MISFLLAEKWRPLCLVQMLLCIAQVTSASPRVDLGYAVYEGTTLANGINQYLGMRYAAPPTGKNRFRRPRRPLHERGVTAAKTFGPLCYGVQGEATEVSPFPTDEDCLFIDVYSPSNISSTTKLPVMLWIQGGGFADLFNPNYNGTGLIEASGRNVIVVSFNYRVGPFGFLASTELAAEHNLNIGIHDQRAAMKWVSQHIDQFGGDPARLTLFGTSIGAGSVLLQALAYGGTPPPAAAVNWSAGIAASVYVPPILEVRNVEYQYDQLLQATNCTNLHCLRSITSAEIQAADFAHPFPGQASLPLFPYGPVIDHSLFTDRASAMWAAGNFTKDKPILLGSTNNEGTLFATQANSSKDIRAFLQTQFPRLSSANISAAEQLYNDVPSKYPGVTTAEAPLYYKLAQMYGDMAFICPALDFASSISEAGVPVYLFRDHIVDPAELAAGFIVPHTWEVEAVWGPEYATNYGALPNATSYRRGQSNSFIVPQVQKFWTSFAITGGDPNALKSASAPTWMEFASSSMRLRLQTNATAMEAVPEIQLSRCATWSRLSPWTHI